MLTRRTTQLLVALICLLLIAHLATPALAAGRRQQQKQDDKDEQEEALALPGGQEQAEGFKEENIHLVQQVQQEWQPREIPTREEDGWRRLKNDESVPKGSHVRLNMTSGEKWVKLEPTRGEQVLEILSRLPDEVVVQRVEEIRRLAKPRSEEFEKAAIELWEQRQQMLSFQANSTRVSESKVTSLTRQLRPSLVTVEILQELEELVEDLDEAATFANDRHQGIQRCLALIRDTSITGDVRSLAAGVIGRAIKLTRDLQNVTILHGGFQVINTAFSHGHISESKALYSLGSLIRGSPEAAKEAMKYPDFFFSLVQRLSHQTEKRVRERVAALIGDLLMEPDNWCWNSFQNAGLCKSDFEFPKSELEMNHHYRYLHTVRQQVCSPKVEL